MNKSHEYNVYGCLCYASPEMSWRLEALPHLPTEGSGDRLQPPPCDCVIRDKMVEDGWTDRRMN